MANKTTFQQKTRVMNKLFEHGINTEKELQNLTLKNIVTIKNITVAEMNVISELQESAKAGKLFSYLGGVDDEQSN